MAGYVSAFSRKKVLVLGDMVADEYIVGKPARISREAPVLILHHTEEFICPGGAGNVAVNLAALGAQTVVVGVVGDDQNGRRLKCRLEEAGVETEGLFVDADRPTATKTRVVGRGTQEMQQQIVRID
ncbi:MAG TPA: PfkB family carbohydrate kinase, partial [Chloroflexota bacterium]|nr:PfkB family carbohydrate kinase [Chloroflexota bacterium]